MADVQVSKAAARRFLLKKLLPRELKSANQVLLQLEAVQLDPVAVVERNHHLVMMNRLSQYTYEDYQEVLGKKQAFEYFANAACLLPMNDFPILKGERTRVQARWAQEKGRYRDAIHLVYDQLDKQGPQPSKAFFTDRKVVGGWDHPSEATTKETTFALRILFECGDIQVSKREGAIRHFALTEHWIPQSVQEDAESISVHEADEALLEKYLRAYRLTDPRDARFGWQKLSAAERKEAVAKRLQDHRLLTVKIENVDRPYYLLDGDIGELEACAHEAKETAVTFLSPLDNLMWRRERVQELFDFYYRWEIYTPKAKRQYGPYTLPVLVGDEIVGRVDPLFDREKKHLFVTAFNGIEKHRAVEPALHTFAEQLGAKGVTITSVNSLS